MENLAIVFLIGLLVFVLLFIKMLKAHIKGKLIVFLVMISFFFIILILLSGYIDLGNFFSKDSLAVKTGMAVVDTIKESVH